MMFTEIVREKVGYSFELICPQIVDQGFLFYSFFLHDCIYEPQPDAYEVDTGSEGLVFSAPKTPSSVISQPPPTLPTFAQNLDKCRVPESHRIVTILWPGPICNAARTAATPTVVSLSSMLGGGVGGGCTVHSAAAPHKQPFSLN